MTFGTTTRSSRDIILCRFIGCSRSKKICGNDHETRRELSSVRLGRARSHVIRFLIREIWGWLHTLPPPPPPSFSTSLSFFLSFFSLSRSINARFFRRFRSLWGTKGKLDFSVCSQHEETRRSIRGSVSYTLAEYTSIGWQRTRGEKEAIVATGLSNNSTHNIDVARWLCAVAVIPFFSFFFLQITPFRFSLRQWRSNDSH